jgi:hypothetical protein
MEPTSTVGARSLPDCSPYARWSPALRKLSAYATAVVGKLRDLAPYAVIELVLPGGSLMALLLWLYRRQKKGPVFPDSLHTGVKHGAEHLVRRLNDRRASFLQGY